MYRDISAVGENETVALVGDTQRTLRIERLIGREQNHSERIGILEAVAEERPAALVLLGDLVNNGSSKTEWNHFDLYMKPVKAAGIPVLPVLGNHDYWGSLTRVRRNVVDRFGALKNKTFYMRPFGDLRLIFLDSNEKDLGVQVWEEQKAWYKTLIQKIENDAGAKGVIVVAHHPPFTNSKSTPDERHVQKAFFPDFFSNRKTLAFITGHAHAYERFEENEKTLIVSGGGGGPRVDLFQGEKSRHQDLFSGPIPRPFHYILMSQSPGQVHFAIKGFEKGQKQIKEWDRFSLPLFKN